MKSLLPALLVYSVHIYIFQFQFIYIYIYIFSDVP
jgi:hypothetical protein